MENVPNQHILLHLQSMKRRLTTLSTNKVIHDSVRQLEFDLYELAQHLNISPKEVNND